jgi:hypothetical protein
MTRNTTASYPARVEYAAAAIMRGEDSRALDDCFEMYDGAFVVAALMRRAATDEALRVMIARMFSSFSWDEMPWHKTARGVAHIPDNQLGAEAAKERARQKASWDSILSVQMKLTQLGEIRPAFRAELTPAGEQYVIPGCERDAAPTVRQLDLF